VFVDGEVVGVQSLMAIDFAALRTVKTGSWLGLAYQGRGIGEEMRTAMLHFAFEGLGALEAHGGGFIDNTSSLKVSRVLGYKDNGQRTVLRRGIPAEMFELRLARSTWEQTEHSAVEISGFEDCREFFIAPHNDGG
jgi:RimJ/RimL family protein N-acetyltransferase